MEFKHLVSPEDNYVEEVKTYFKDKAHGYDNVDKQLYWVLSDKLLWHAMQKHLLDKLPASFTFLDAGGGTGRWTHKILENYPKAKAVIYDLSKDMLAEARSKLERDGLIDRCTIINDNLNNINEQLPPNNFDLVYNFHNVIGFVDDVPTLFKNIYKTVKPNGHFVTFAPNLFHNIFFNIFVKNLKEAKVSSDNGYGRFTTSMPYMNLFTPKQLQDYYQQAEFDVILNSGFPNFIYPGYQETQLEGQTTTIANVLSSEDNFDKIYEMEEQYLDSPDIAARSNNLFIVGKKSI